MRIKRPGPGQGEVSVEASAPFVIGTQRSLLTAQEYCISHPQAQVNGILKGSYYGTISDQISITCKGGEGKDKTRLRTLLDYKDEVGQPFYSTLRRFLDTLSA